MQFDTMVQKCTRITKNTDGSHEARRPRSLTLEPTNYSINCYTQKKKMAVVDILKAIRSGSLFSCKATVVVIAQNKSLIIILLNFEDT